MLYSHHHFDHASGASVFNDTAELIAHENFGPALKEGSMAFPASFAAFGLVDRNANGRFERDELQGPARDFLMPMDRNGDGAVTPAELYADVTPPESTHSGRRTVTLGGKTVELIHPGPNHSADATILHFPAERAVFVVDYVAVKQLPGVVSGGAPLGDWIEAIRAVEALDFDTVVPGHGDVGTKADVAAYRQYFEDLVAAVSEGIAAGRTVEQLQASNILERYRDWANYDPGRNQHIALAYEGLMAARR